MNTCSKRNITTTKVLLNRCVFKAFLKALTDENCLTVSGKLHV